MKLSRYPTGCSRCARLQKLPGWCTLPWASRSATSHPSGSGGHNCALSWPEFESYQDRISGISPQWISSIRICCWGLVLAIWFFWEWIATTLFFLGSFYYPCRRSWRVVSLEVCRLRSHVGVRWGGQSPIHCVVCAINLVATLLQLLLLLVTRWSVFYCLGATFVSLVRSVETVNEADTYMKRGTASLLLWICEVSLSALIFLEGAHFLSAPESVFLASKRV
jgi:hypothetical protein